MSKNSYGHRTVHSSSSPSLYGYFFSRQVLRPRRMRIVGALSEVWNFGCLEISAEYDLLLVIFGCIFLWKYIHSTIGLRFIVRKLISSALEQCIWSKLIEICWLLSSEIITGGFVLRTLRFPVITSEPIVSVHGPWTLYKLTFI